MMRNSADFDGALIDYKSKGHTVELVGKEKLRRRADVYHLKVTMKDGHVQHYYLDAESGIELKTTSRVDHRHRRRSSRSRPRCRTTSR